jgi:hypothetical protein
VDDEPCNDVTELIDLLTNAFSIQKTIDQYKGDLSTIFLKPNEHILDYISRVKDLQSTIIDADRREYGYVGQHLTDINTLMARSFCEGLPLKYRLQLKLESYINPFEAFSAAKIIAKRLELDKTRYGRNLQNFNIHPIRQISQPVTHSTNTLTRMRRDYNEGNPTSHNSNNNRPRYSNNSPPPPNIQNSSQNAPYRHSSYYDKQCNYCKMYGHLEKDCRRKRYCESQQQGNKASPSGRQDNPRKDQNKKMCPVK